MLFGAIIIITERESMFFAGMFIYSLRKYANYSTIKAILEASITSAYFIAIWFPIALFIIFKIIFTKKTMDWGKTRHGVAKCSVLEDK